MLRQSPAFIDGVKSTHSQSRIRRNRPRIKSCDLALPENGAIAPIQGSSETQSCHCCKRLRFGFELVLKHSRLGLHW